MILARGFFINNCGYTPVNAILKLIWMIIEAFTMDSVSAPPSPSLLKTEEKVFATNLLAVFENYADNIKVLSLDCFDTLLWRKTAAPTDVFYDLQNRPTFKALGYTALMRFQSEMQARNLKKIQLKEHEVQLRDIYRACFSKLSEAQLNALEEEELAEEIATCYALPTVVELMRRANAKGVKIIIVSDTYLTQPQLQRLLASHLPPDVMTSIDTIFCSSEFGKSKTRGLFHHVLEKLDIPPTALLHIGDNPVSDFAASRAYKMHAIHLLHHDNNITDLLRMNAASAALFDPNARNTRALLSVFRGVLASAQFSPEKPEQMIGYASLGTIMYSFGRFILEEIEKIKCAGKQPKIMFIMRDGYLPSLVCDALSEAPIGKRISISRFAATAASFRTKEEIDVFLIGVIPTNRFKEIGKQLLLPDELVKSMLQTCMKASDPAYKFVEMINKADTTKLIIKNSSAYRERLKQHLKNELDIQAGDTAVFVDLGYSGTAQRLLEPILREEMQIDVAGLYLISLGVAGWNTSRSGLLDAAWCDERMMRTFVSFIALLELVCTSNGASVVDYDAKGQPIYSELNDNKKQDGKLKLIQSECLRFVKDADAFFKAANKAISIRELGESAMAELGRLLFLATENEIRYLETFKFDLNLGTNDVFSAFDQNAGLNSLRKRGLFFSFLEKNDKSWRPTSSLELRAAGIELAVTLMASNRFGLEFGMKDLSLRREQLEVIAIRNQEVSRATMEAVFTHDGYFSLAIPVGSGNMQIGLLFGQKYEWVQVECAELIQMNAYLTTTESIFSEDCWSLVALGQMNDKGGKLFECVVDASLMMVAVPQKSADKKYILRVVFRPVVKR